MYYEEKVIDGKLYWRSTPDDEWTFVDYQSLLQKYKEVIRLLNLSEEKAIEKLEEVK